MEACKRARAQPTCGSIRKGAYHATSTRAHLYRVDNSIGRMFCTSSRSAKRTSHSLEEQCHEVWRSISRVLVRQGPSRRKPVMAWTPMERCDLGQARYRWPYQATTGRTGHGRHDPPGGSFTVVTSLCQWTKQANVWTSVLEVASIPAAE